jgi:uncharacterized protein (TIGR03437 family)
LDGTPLPLIYVSPQQINAQLPEDAQGPAVLRVTTASGFSDTAVTISETAPAIFPGGILHADAKATPVSSAAPARAGETLVVYMTGLGRVDGPIAAGQKAPLSPLLNVLAPVEVDLGGVSVTPGFAGLTPGFAGLYQVNAMVPPDLPSKVYSLRVLVRGNSSNAMNVPVQARAP